MKCLGRAACRIARAGLACCVILCGLSCHREPVVASVCTLIGCNDSLRITLAPTAPLPYRATLGFPGGAAVAFTCSSAGVADRIGEGIYSLTCSVESFTIQCARNPSYCSTSPVRVELAGESGVIRSGTLVPLYTMSQPNGPRCEPTCYSGVATLP